MVGTVPITKEEHKAAVFALMRRSVQLGFLLPDPEKLHTSGPDAVAAAKMVIAEIEKARAELLALLDEQPQ